MQKTFAATCIIDARVSTDQQLTGTGLENQLAVCQYHANAHDWRSLRPYTKPYSGRKEEREDFDQILTDIKQFKRDGTPVDYYLFVSIDRLTRLGTNRFSAMKQKIQKLGVQPVNVRGSMDKPTCTQGGVIFLRRVVYF